MKAYLPPHVLEAIDQETFPYFFSRSLMDIYLENSPKKTGTVFICTQVHNGFGDYIALLKTGWALQEAHPNIQFELVYTYTKTLPEVDLKGLQVHPFLEHPEHPILEPILEGKPADEISAEAILAETLYERMKDALAIIHIALALNTFDNPELKEKSLYFSEVGNFMGITDSLQFNWYSLGFSPFEEGIFLTNPFQPKENRSKFFGYFSRSKQQQSLFKELALKFDEKAKVHIPKKMLTYLEFQEEMSDSAFLVGCTGDNSLSECLALGKVPYYEILPHKTAQILSLYHLAKFLRLKAITAYFEAMGKGEKGAVDDLYKTLTHKNFQAEWTGFIAYIHKYCRMENALIARFRRLVMDTGDLELSLAEEVKLGTLSYEDARKTFCNKLLY